MTHMTQSWKKQTGQRIDSIDVTLGQVFLGTDEGFGHGCSAVAVSYPEFLSGKLNDQVHAIFGSTILAEVRAAAEAAAA